MINQRIIKKVGKLLALGAAGSGGTEAEAALALQRAQELLEAHGLTMAQVQASQGKGGKLNFRVNEAVAYRQKKNHLAQFEQGLVATTGKLTETVPLIARLSNEPGLRVIFVGEETDVMVATEIFAWLQNDVRRRARRYVEQAQQLNQRLFGENPARKKGWSPSHRSFAEGYAARMYQRAVALRDRERPQTYALVRVGKKEEIARYLAKENVKDQKSKRHRGKMDYAAMAAGAAQAENPSLNFRRGLK